MHGIGIVIYIVIVFSVIFTIWGIRIHRRKYRIAYADRVVIPVVKEFFPNGEFVPFGKTCDVLNMYSYFGLFRRDMFENVNFYMNSNDERGIETFSYDSFHNSTPTSTHGGGTCTTGSSAESADPYEATRNLIRTIIAIINDLSNAISNT